MVLASGLTLLGTAKAPPADAAVPTLRLMQHQQLTCGTQVIYDAEVNVADPTAVHVRLIWQLGGLSPFADSAMVGQVNGLHQEHLAGEPYGAITVSSVVKTLRADDRAAIAVVYQLQKDDVSPAACGFVDALIDVGRPVHLTGSDGLPVTLTLLPPSPAAPSSGPSDDHG